MEHPKKRPAESRTEQVRVLRYQHLNNHRRLFGGQLMAWIDELAGIAAIRHSGADVITAAVDQLLFKAPASLGDLLRLVATVTWTGRTSMEVRVDTYIEDGARGEKIINRAYIVMVATDENGTPTPVPALLPETEEEKAEWAAGEKRSALRRKRRDEKY